ncbi:MAG: TetR/AcrR family transcriptional regulator [Actinobacteria bacterium]|nr:TetR/AcrR family transcriptional regulator [Actinomycetota bacterium]MCL5446977.1 TetR/AcrR family transcriptional regulator [Actinomycetota bacterium]
MNAASRIPGDSTSTHYPSRNFTGTGPLDMPASAQAKDKDRPRQRRMPAGKRREQLLSMAGIAFSRKGYKGTTMEDISMLAGVTKPILYQHFPSKRSLYKELVTEASNKLIKAIASATYGATSPKEQVELGFVAFFTLLATEMDTFRLLLMSDMQDDRDLSIALRNVEDSIASIIYSLIDIGLDEEHRTLLATAVVGMGVAVSRHWVEVYGHSDPPPPPSTDEAAQIARRLADLVWAGLRAVHAD